MGWYINGEHFLEPKNKEEFLDLVAQFMGDDARYYVDRCLVDLLDVMHKVEKMNANEYSSSSKALEAVYDMLLEMD